MSLQNMIAATMIGMQMRVVDGVQRPSFQYMAQQDQGLILVRAVAGIDDRGSVLACEDNVIRRKPAALQYMH
jgi:hypothetical protein